MKILDKLKNMIFEDEEEQEQEEVKEVKKEKVVQEDEEEIVRKIDVEKSVKRPVIKEYDDEELLTFEQDVKKGPIIFDDDDFVPDFKLEEEREPDIKEDKILYGGYTEIKEKMPKEAFKPSPVISPVYGILDKNYKAEDKKEVKHKSLDHLFVEERKKKIDLDQIREKAYGEVIKSEKEIEEPVEEEKDTLLYDISTEDKPAVSNVTIGDAEEYYDDLGLEYNVDYKDEKIEKKTRSSKNKGLAEEIEDEIKGDVHEINQVEEIEEETPEEIQIPKDDLDDMEEKNLYDLIDMMYDSKE